VCSKILRDFWHACAAGFGPSKRVFVLCVLFDDYTFCVRTYRNSIFTDSSCSDDELVLTII
jgi:hypothetical protein